jgi:CDP-paratose 2-epimerase
MNLLITGGCGFLGSNLSADAIRRGINLCVFDNLYRNGAIENLRWLAQQGDFKYVNGDIRNENDVAKSISEFGPDVVFHLAGQVAMTTSLENPRFDFEVNVVGTFNVLEAVRKCAKDAIVVYSSTNKVYGDLAQFSYRETETRFECLDRPHGFDENTPLDFRSPYGCSKGAADQYILDYGRMFDLKTVVLRHSSMYGGRQHSTYDQGWVGWFCRKAIDASRLLNPEPFSISGTGKQVRDVLHADDMVRLYHAAVENIDCANGEVFNIGGGNKNSLSLIELFSLLESLIDVRLNYYKLPERISDQKVFVANISKASKILGWTPEIGCNEGIERMLNWLLDAQDLS